MSRRRKRLADGVGILREHRSGDGGWRRFPFHYTVLALSEMPGRIAVDELLYAVPRLERMLRRRGRGDQFGERRRAVATRVLERV